jgi:hypothetical protein
MAQEEFEVIVTIVGTMKEGKNGKERENINIRII